VCEHHFRDLPGRQPFAHLCHHLRSQSRQPPLDERENGSSG
jgi:hypothetical protein